uniref:Uncharacterized protein n=1 Tax=Arundo donax TaxID=35708 RepID=A0A0A8ZZG9_ARUDO
MIRRSQKYTQRIIWCLEKENGVPTAILKCCTHWIIRCSHSYMRRIIR